jgi:hypothetical protein
MVIFLNAYQSLFVGFEFRLTYRIMNIIQRCLRRGIVTLCMVGGQGIGLALETLCVSWPA